MHQDEVLLVRRGNEPQKGLWSVPGGALELGESLEQGVQREVLEETGLEVRVLQFAEVFERIMTDDSGADLDRIRALFQPHIGKRRGVF